MRTAYERIYEINRVLDQDLDGIARVQAGLQSSGFRDMIFGNFETRLANMHQELDRRLAR